MLLFYAKIIVKESCSFELAEEEEEEITLSFLNYSHW